MNKMIAVACRQVGGQVELARRLGIHQTFVNNWIAERKKVPPRHAKIIENMLGLPKEKIRPDYPWEIFK